MERIALTFRVLVQRFGKGRVADALLAKWLSDPAGDEGFRRLGALILLWDDGARLNHLAERFDDVHAPRDGYWRPGLSNSEAAFKREARKRAA